MNPYNWEFCIFCILACYILLFFFFLFPPSYRNTWCAASALVSRTKRREKGNIPHVAGNRANPRCLNLKVFKWKQKIYVAFWVTDGKGSLGGSFENDQSPSSWRRVKCKFSKTPELCLCVNGRKHNFSETLLPHMWITAVVNISSEHVQETWWF